MRRGFSPIGALSTLIFFLAAVVICLQLAHTKSVPEWRLPPPVVWLLEVAIFGMIVYAWKPRISFGAWMVGIGVLVLVRLSLTATCTLGYQVVQQSASLEGLGAQHLSGPVLRICAALFAVMVLYPMRGVLPVRLLAAREGRRISTSAAGSATSGSGAANEPALWFVRGEEKIPVWLGAGRQSDDDAIVPDLAQDETIEGSVLLPLREVLAQVPPELVSQKAMECQDSTFVSLPLSVIVPQLKEARIVVRLDDLRNWIPSETINVPPDWADPGAEAPLVFLPLELVVPRLPEELLELPPPSPPDWAKDKQADTVVFAII